MKLPIHSDVDSHFCKECEKFKKQGKHPGRDYELCMGQSFGNTPRPPQANWDAWCLQNGLPTGRRWKNSAKTKSTEKVLAKPKSKPTRPSTYGPGTELKKIFETLGVATQGCGSCAATLRQMDVYCVDGCLQHRDELIKTIKNNASGISFLKKLMAVKNAVTHGLLFLAHNPLDPISECFDEAIRRADMNDTTHDRISELEEKRLAARLAHREAYAKLVPHVDPKPRPKITDEPIYTPVTFEGIPQTNLIYTIYPHKRSENWSWNIKQLLDRLKLFNGVRSIGVITDPETATLEEVQTFFSGERIDHWFSVPNQPLIGSPGHMMSDDGANALIGEGLTFIPLLHTLPRTENNITFYAHAKGVRYNNGHSTLRWAKMLYDHSLDNFPQVIEQLEKFPMTGCFKRYYDFDLTRNWRWHFSGTFFWFRNQDVFSNINWTRLHPNMYGQVEAWPAGMFRASEVGCLFGDGAQHLYVEAELQKWEALSKEPLK